MTDTALSIEENLFWECRANGKPKPSYSWLKNGDPVMPEVRGSVTSTAGRRSETQGLIGVKCSGEVDEHRCFHAKQLLSCLCSCYPCPYCEVQLLCNHFRMTSSMLDKRLEEDVKVKGPSCSKSQICDVKSQ